MDDATITAYDEHAAEYAADWLAQPPDDVLHALVREFFGPGPTADVGCGAGRDTAWLTEEGYEAVGFDASDGLLQQARLRFPSTEFAVAALPALAGVASGRFANVLCETVIMHLGPGERAASVARLLDILRPGGTLYLSWRVTPDDGQRDERGRLYAGFPAAEVMTALGDAQILHDSESDSESSGKLVHRVVARRPGATA